MRTYKVTQAEYNRNNDAPFNVNADAININQGVAVFFATDPGAMEGTQATLVLALAPGQWSRIEEVQE